MKLLNNVLLTGIITLISFSAVSAKETVMYKKVDKNGNITFTDKPIPGSEPIKVKTDTNVVSTPKAQVLRNPNAGTSQANQQKPFKYDVLAIDTPKSDEAVRANDGVINVVVGITPSLQPIHSIQLKLDGTNVGQQQKVPYFTLNDVERGTHGLQAVIINDQTGEPIQNSDTIKFHTLKTSVLNNNRRNRGR